MGRRQKTYTFVRNAQNSLHTFPRNFPVGRKIATCCRQVANLLATRQTIWTCQDVANKSASSWPQVVVTEFEKRHDATDITDFCPRQLVMD